MLHGEVQPIPSKRGGPEEVTSYLGFEPHCAARSANGSNTAIVSTMSIDVLSLVLVSDVPGQRERSRAFLPMGRVVSSLVDGAAVADEQ